MAWFYHYTDEAGFQALTSGRQFLPSGLPSRYEATGSSAYPIGDLQVAEFGESEVLNTEMAAKVGQIHIGPPRDEDRVLGAAISGYFTQVMLHPDVAFPGIARDANYGAGWYVTNLPPSTPTDKLLDALWRGDHSRHRNTAYWLLLATRDERVQLPDAARPGVRFIPLCTGFRFMGDKPKPWIICNSSVYLLEAGTRQHNSFGRTVWQTLYTTTAAVSVVPRYLAMVDAFSLLGRREQERLLTAFGTHLFGDESPMAWLRQNHPDVVGAAERGTSALCTITVATGATVDFVATFGHSTVDFTAADWTDLSDELFVAGHPAATLAAANSGLALDATIPEAWLNRAASSSALGSYEDALQAYDRALALRPDYHQATINKAGLLIKLDRLSDALAMLDTVLASQPESVSALHNKAIILARLNRLDEAITAFDQALRIDDSMPEVWNGLGAAVVARLRKAGHDGGLEADLARAMDCFWQSLTRRPAYATARRNLLEVLNLILPSPPFVHRCEPLLREIIVADDEALTLMMTRVRSHQIIELHPRYLHLIRKKLGLSRRRLESILIPGADFVAGYLQGRVSDEDIRPATARLLCHALSAPLIRTGLLDVVSVMVRQLLPHATSVDERLQVAKTLNDCGIVMRTMADFDGALSCYENARPIYSGANDRARTAHVAYNIGRVYQQRGRAGDAESARSAYLEALGMYTVLKLRSDLKATEERLRELAALR
jgi:tetratricopeptide (TPR) repeat protein